MSEADPALPPLRSNGSYKAIWGSQAASALGTGIADVAYPLLIFAVSHSPVATGVTATVVELARQVGQLASVGWIDRVRRRLLVITCQAVRAVCMCASALVAWQHIGGVVPLIAIAGIGGLAGAPVGSSMMALLLEAVRGPQLEQAIAQDEARRHGARIAATGVGGLLFGLERAVPFLASGLSFLLSAAGVCFVGTDASGSGRRGGKVEERRSAPGEVKAALRWFRGEPDRTLLIACLALLNFSFAGLETFVIVAARTDAASAAEVGLALMLISIGGLSGALLANMILRRFGRPLSVYAALWGGAALLATLAFAPDFLALGLIGAGIAFLVPPANVVIVTSVFGAVPPELGGRVISLASLLGSGLGIAGPAAAGAMFAVLGQEAALPLTIPAILTAAAVTVIPRVRATALGADREADERPAQRRDLDQQL